VTAGDRSRIALAIAAAEQGTTGRIAVRVLTDGDLDAFERAKGEFVRAGLHQHEHGNAALFLIAPKARKFAVIGDAALHDRVGDSFWQRLVDEMQPYFVRDAIADGVVAGVGRIGEVLQTHFAAPQSAP
jgi:uncharacterized membrane protein